jgi:4-amino-4-deoxy-L-arabinose transferase-like glycosyltransferase
MRRFALLLLLIAIVLGGYLRFSGIGRLEMSDDEGASWAAAAAPSLSDVVTLQERLNPGKLAVHEIALHGWMALLSDRIAAQRSLSAALGTISILIVFWIAWELNRPSTDSEDVGQTARDEATMIAALGTLVYAVNLVTIKYAREARMYPVMLAAILLQVGFFVRASRRGGIASYLGAGLFAVVAIATNFAAALIPATEGLWLLYLLMRSGLRPRNPQSQRAWALLAALALAAVAFFAFAMPALRGATNAVKSGAITWITRPPIWEPVALFNKATGTLAFPVLGLAAAYGAWRGWRDRPDAIRFALLWMWAPPVLMVIVSYTVRPLFVERYALSCFVPFFILVGIGIWELREQQWRAAALLVVLAMSLGHVAVFDRKLHDAQWREAAALGAASLRTGETMTAVPAYSIWVVRYYLPPPERAHTIDFVRAHRDASVVLLRDHGVAPTVAATIRRDYPVELAKLRGVIVLRR